MICSVLVAVLMLSSAAPASEFACKPAYQKKIASITYKEFDRSADIVGYTTAVLGTAGYITGVIRAAGVEVLVFALMGAVFVAPVSYFIGNAGTELGGAVSNWIRHLKSNSYVRAVNLIEFAQMSTAERAALKARMGGYFEDPIQKLQTELLPETHLDYVQIEKRLVEGATSTDFCPNGKPMRYKKLRRLLVEDVAG